MWQYGFITSLVPQRFVFGLFEEMRLDSERMVTNSSAAEGCIPTWGDK